MNVLARLEAHWVVLEAELVEINKDITQCEQYETPASLYCTSVLSAHSSLVDGPFLAASSADMPDTHTAGA